MPESLRIPVTDNESVSGVAYRATPGNQMGVTLILGHGAGADQSNKFLVNTSERLANRGVDTVTFNFLYTEQRRAAPDRNDKLEACWRAAIQFSRAHNQLVTHKLVIGGKSMGGRIASQVAAQGIANLSGLVFLGYPLHPPGRPDRLRSAHLPQITVPMLFVQGSRDSFGTPEEIQPILSKLEAPITLYTVENGDHSFKVPKRSALTQEEVYERILDQITNWLTGIVGHR